MATQMYFPLPSNFTSWNDIMHYANSSTGNLFGNVMLLGLMVIILAFSLRFGRMRAMLITCFIGMIFSLLFLAIGLVDAWYLYACVIGTVASAYFVYRENSGTYG